MKIKLPRPRVYIPNDSYHDFSPAEKYGELVYITKGALNKTQPNQMARLAEEAFADANEKDFIVISSLPVLCGVVCAMFALRFGRLNLLIHDKHNPSVYTPRLLVFGQGAQHKEELKNDGSSARASKNSKSTTRPSS